MDAAFAQLLILAGLRKLADSIRTEVQSMPIMHDIMDHEIIGPAIRQGLQQGLQQGIQQGMQQEGISILRRLIEKRSMTIIGDPEVDKIMDIDPTRVGWPWGSKLARPPSTRRRPAQGPTAGSWPATRYTTSSV